MTSTPVVSKRAEIFRTLVQSLPARRTQTSNWLVKFFGPKHPFVGKFMGGWMEVHLEDPASRAAYFGVYEREITIWLKHFLSGRECTIFDVGANCGLFSLASGLLGAASSSVHAFEPDPNTFTWLERNCALNPNLRISTHNLAVSRECGKVKFLSSDPSRARSLWSRMPLNGGAPKEEGQIEIEVDAISLDSFRTKSGIKTVDLVKIDVEGAEGFVLEGMREGIRSKVYKRILLELHTWGLPPEHTPERIFAILMDAGYTGFHFAHPFDLEKADKLRAYYDLRFRDGKGILEPIRPESTLTTWEHYLFLAPSTPV